MGKNRLPTDPTPATPGVDGIAKAADPAVPAGKPPPETRMLTEFEQAEAKALMAEKHCMDARKATLLARQEIVNLEKQIVGLREENLRLQAEIHNQAAKKTDADRAAWLRAHGVEDADKADLLGDRLVIQRGAAATPKV